LSKVNVESKEPEELVAGIFTDDGHDDEVDFNLFHMKLGRKLKSCNTHRNGRILRRRTVSHGFLPGMMTAKMLP